MEKIILVVYLRVGNVPADSVESLVHQISLDLEQREKEGVIHYIFPVRDGESRIECINPKLVSEEDYQQAKKALENNQKIMNEIFENYQKQSNDFRERL